MGPLASCCSMVRSRFAFRAMGLSSFRQGKLHILRFRLGRKLTHSAALSLQIGPALLDSDLGAAHAAFFCFHPRTRMAPRSDDVTLRLFATRF